MNTSMTIGMRVVVFFLAAASLFALGSADSESIVSGEITTISATSDGAVAVTGWVCQPTAQPAARIDLYAGRPFPVGQIITSTKAEAIDENAHCKNSMIGRGFSFQLGPETLFRYGGLRVFAYSIIPGEQGHVNLSSQVDAVLPEYFPTNTPGRTCNITDISSLKNCLSQANKYDSFSLQQDLTCSSVSDCCNGDGKAIINFSNVANRAVEGNGHIIHRANAALACGAVTIDKSSNILIRNLLIDDGEKVQPCELSVKGCPSTVSITNSKNIRLENTHIYFGKSYVVRVWGTDGFVFIHSSLSESGQIGIYVGHFQFAPSKNIVVAESTFAFTRTNAIAIQGASGSSAEEPVLIIGNVFTGNHWHGLWPVPGVKNGITNGGQILIADATNARITGNIIGNGACGNCNPSGQPVWAVEIGQGGQPEPGGVSKLSIENNFVFADSGFDTGKGPMAFFQNRNTRVSDVSLSNNRIAGKIALDNLTQSVSRINNSQEPSISYHSALSLSPSPILGAPASPNLLCLHKGSEVVVQGIACENSDVVQSVLGYAYERR